MYSTHTAELANLPQLPLSAKTVHIVPALDGNSLIAIGPLCDAGCQVLFSASTVKVTLNDKLVLQGTRTPYTRLWHFDLPTTTPPLQAHLALSSMKPVDLVAFSHAALFSPALSTLESALQKNLLLGFPGLSLRTLRAHPPNSIATSQGHLDQTRKNQRSTKPPPPSPEDDPFPI